MYLLIRFIPLVGRTFLIFFICHLHLFLNLNFCIICLQARSGSASSYRSLSQVTIFRLKGTIDQLIKIQMKQSLQHRFSTTFSDSGACVLKLHSLACFHSFSMYLVNMWQNTIQFLVGLLVVRLSKLIVVSPKIQCRNTCSSRKMICM